MISRMSLRVRLIVILLFTVTVPILFTGYFMMSRAETALLSEKEAKLFGYARLLDKHLEGSYNDILAREGVLNSDRDTKIKTLNRVLRDYTDRVASTHPGLGIGYYSKELDAILTYGPSKEFDETVGQSIFTGHQGYTVMESGKEMVQSGPLVRGTIMNCMVPIIREGEVIGYIWSNELLSDIEAQISGMENRVHESIVIGIFCALCLAYLLTANIARGVETIKNGLKTLQKNISYRLPPLKAEMGDIVEAINEMSDALKNMKTHTENIVASTPNGLITVNNQGIITIFNLQAERFTGVSARDIIERPYMEAFRPWSQLVEIFKNAFAGEPFQNKELTLSFQNRQTPLLITTSALLSANDEQTGILMIIRDLTDTKKLEEQVRRADRLAVTGELAAGIAHEVRNPLTAITGYLQLLAVDMQQSDPRHEFTRIITKEIVRLNYLIDQLLYFPRPLPPQFLTTDLHKVIEECLLLINNPAILKKVNIVTDFKDNLPPVKLDAVQFKQVLFNIMLNGIQAIKDSGSLFLRTCYDSTSSHVCLQIEDTGSGIPAENIPRLFDPFFTTKEKGTGLGLSVVDKIMEVHQGFIEVESEIGKGTCFSLYLPVQEEVKENG